MASIHRKKDSAFWHCAYYLPDGRRTLRSTGTSDKKKALAICLEYERAAREGREGRLTEARARDAITTIYKLANSEDLPQSTVTDYLTSWLKTKKLTLAESSLAEYQNAVELLLKHLDHKASKHMDAISLRDVTAFRDDLADRISGSTVNKLIKILRSAWSRALKDGVIRDNVLARVDLVKASKAQRRAFTLKELQDILAACDVEWRGMVLCGVYLGQRLGDIARLTWRSVDLAEKQVRLVTQKTGKSMKIPLHPVLESYFMELSAPDDADAPVFPRAAATAEIRVGTLSNQFAGLLASAGLQDKRTHAKHEDGQGRDAERSPSRLSFHCLRHTATSLLKNAGVSNVVAMEIIGHDSEAVSRHYTHIEFDALSNAMGKLPDITSIQKPEVKK
jgi:integrase